jgi:chemosensory pili system protein ChpA (sensor histidine kinase/response regulator)
VRVRRSFHTLKGSGRMVGARNVGEFAWSIENLLNRVISGTLARTPGMLALLRGGIAALPQLVDQLEHGTAPRADVGLLIARAQAFAEGRDPEGVAPVTLPVQDRVAVRLASRPEPAPAAPADETSLIATEILLANDPALPKPLPPKAGPITVSASATGIVPVLEPPTRFVRVTDEPSRARASDREPSRTPPPPPKSGSEFVMIAPDRPVPAGSDPVLIDIYRKEVTSHVSAVRQWLRDCEGRFAPYAVTEALHRACHTLAGASRMAEAKHGVRVAEPLNLYIRKLYDHGLGLPEAGRRVLAGVVEAMDEVVAHFDENTAYFTRHDELLAQLRWLDADAEREIKARGLKPAEVLEQSGPLPPDVELMSVDAMIDEALPTTPARAPAAPPPVAAAPPPAAPAPPSAPATAGAEQFDAEIAAIFSEEATELLEAADAALAAFRAEPGDEEKVTELKRVLHTLKGGARMAGVTAMGDLAHEVESVLIQTAATRTSGEPRTLDVLQASLDELHRMRETVSAGRPVGAARDLVTRIRSLYRTPPGPPVLKTVAAEQPLPTPAVESPPPPAPVATPPVVKDIAASGRHPAPDAGAARAVASAAASVPVVKAADDTVAQPALAPSGEPGTASVGDVAANRALVAEESLQLGRSMDSVQGVAAMEQSRSFVLPPGREPQPAPERQELARVDADLLDSLLNNAGEVSIFRARSSSSCLGRVQPRGAGRVVHAAEGAAAQARDRDRGADPAPPQSKSAGRRTSIRWSWTATRDPAVLPRARRVRQRRRERQGLLENLTREAQNLLMQQARVVTDLQNGLMRTRMVPFQRTCSG